MKKRRNGFTLVEVLAALAVIVILTATLIITVKGQVDHATERNTATTFNAIAAQLDVQTADMEAGDIAKLGSAGALFDQHLISAKQKAELQKKHAQISIKGGDFTIKAAGAK